MAKYQGDVRPLSNDPRYMGLVFTSHRTGTIEEAIDQARTAWDFGLSEQRVPTGVSRDRAALLQHLNLLHDKADALLDHCRVEHEQEARIQAQVDGFVDQAFLDHMNNDPRN